MTAHATPLVSVIVPCYNAERFLAATLESVFAQTYAALEIILVDDGSTDGTRALIEACGDRVTAIFGPNAGAAAARNIGMAVARGEFIQFLDADDLLMPDAIAARVRALQQSDAGVAYSDWQKLVELAPGSFALQEVVARTLAPDAALDLFRGFWCPPAALLYRRRACIAIGPWKQHLAPIEDARYMLDAALAGEAWLHVPGIGAHYRIHLGPSHSRRDPVRFLRAVFENAMELRDLWRERGQLDGPHVAALADCFNYVARSAFAHDAALFDQALAALYEARPGFELTWPKLADRLRRLFGRALSLRLLALLGKPAS